MKNKNLIIHPCENNKCLPMNCDANNSTGLCLIIPVYIHEVCKNKHLLVIVEVYKYDHLYARQIKEIFTGDCDNCCCYKNLISRLYAGDFEFYFTDICEPTSICIEVKTQYICS